MAHSQLTLLPSSPFCFPSLRLLSPAGEPGKHKTYHVVLTANAAKYVQWQCRVMYYWYKKRKAEQGPDGQMGGFTRVLHEGRGDELMEEIPSCVVDRLSQEYGFVVLSRPNALVQMLDRRGRGH